MAYRRTEHVAARLSASRERILGAALDIVAEQGYAGCSVTAVAEHAGVATGTVYQHFRNKAALVAEVFRTASQHEIDAFTRATRPDVTAQGGPVVDRLVAGIETFALRALASGRMAYALIAEPVDPAVDSERLIFRRAYADVIAALIAEGVATGELPPQDVEVAATALVGALAESLVGPLAAGAADNRTVPALTAFARRALGATP
jgi:AcrR family transcriptional regulator